MERALTYDVYGVVGLSNLPNIHLDGYRSKHDVCFVYNYPFINWAQEVWQSDEREHASGFIISAINNNESIIFFLITVV